MAGRPVDIRVEDSERRFAGVAILYALYTQCQENTQAGDHSATHVQSYMRYMS